MNSKATFNKAGFLKFMALIVMGALLTGDFGCSRSSESAYDIVVYGGTSGGVIAAVKAAKMGKSVMLIEPGRHLGGLSSGGLGATDIGNKGAIGGMSRDFYQRIRRYYANESAWKSENREEFKGGGHEPGEDAAWTFEPHVAEKIFNDLISEAGVPAVFGERLDLENGAVMNGAAVAEIVMESGKRFRGKIFIDATYEGDLMAAAGVSYTYGRESNETYNETLNGVQVANAVYHQFIEDVDGYIIPGDPASGLLPGILPSVLPDGTGDEKIQAYCFRLCLTDDPGNRIPVSKPEGYDERMFELLLRNFEAGDLRIPWIHTLMPNRKTDCNNRYAVSTDYIGMNYDYPEGSYEIRDRIIREHELYTKGLLWTLANHPRVPKEIRDYFSLWGYPKDEYVDNGHFSHQLYVREVRRMIGGYVMTQHDCQGRVIAEDPVGLAAYTMDSHHVQRYVNENGHVRNEGDVQVGGFTPYPISYRSLVPKETECTNLFVPLCLSSSHIAFGSIRMEPVFMVLGESAATAAAFAIDENVNVQKIDYRRLADRLAADGQILTWKE